MAYEYYAIDNNHNNFVTKLGFIPWYAGICPLRNRFVSRYYYTQNDDRTVSALNSGSLLFNTAFEGKSIYTELVAAYIPLVRLSLGAMVSKTEMEQIDFARLDTLTEEAIEEARLEVEKQNEAKFTAQNLLAGGGNFLLNAAMPILAHKSQYRDFDWSFSGYSRLGFALPEIGTISSDTEVWFQYGAIFDFRADLGLPITVEKGGGFDILVRAQFSQFYNNGVASALELKNGFWYGELLGGIEFSNFRISVTFPRTFERVKALKFQEAESVNDMYFSPTIGVTVVGFN